MADADGDAPVTFAQRRAAAEAEPHSERARRESLAAQLRAGRATRTTPDGFRTSQPDYEERRRDFLAALRAQNATAGAAAMGAGAGAADRSNRFLHPRPADGPNLDPRTGPRAAKPTRPPITHWISPRVKRFFLVLVILLAINSRRFYRILFEEADDADRRAARPWTARPAATVAPPAAAPNAARRPDAAPVSPAEAAERGNDDL